MPLAQHAFIRSITLLSNSVAWSNLGIMYFMQGRLDLANKAFQVIILAFLYPLRFGEAMISREISQEIYLET